MLFEVLQTWITRIICEVKTSYYLLALSVLCFVPYLVDKSMNGLGVGILFSKIVKQNCIWPKYKVNRMSTAFSWSNTNRPATNRARCFSFLFILSGFLKKEGSQPSSINTQQKIASTPEKTRRRKNANFRKGLRKRSLNNSHD